MIYFDKKKEDFYGTKRWCAETYQMQSTRLSDGDPPAVTKVIALLFICKKESME